MYFYKSRILFLGILLFFTSSAFADSATDQLVKILDGLQTLQANFSQNVLDGRGNVLQQTTGEMTMQRPGKFRWAVSKPSKQLLIADGEKIWFYDVGLQQVTIQQQQSIQTNSPAALLSGSPQVLAQNFIVTQMAGDQAFKLVPKEKRGLFRSVELKFDNNKLQSMRLVDNLGQVTFVTFSRVQNNPVLNPRLFHFVPPQGVDVVRS